MAPRDHLHGWSTPRKRAGARVIPHEVAQPPPPVASPSEQTSALRPAESGVLAASLPSTWVSRAVGQRDDNDSATADAIEELIGEAGH